MDLTLCRERESHIPPIQGEVGKIIHSKRPIWKGICYTPGSTNIAGWKMDPDWVDVFPIEDGDIPAKGYVIV